MFQCSKQLMTMARTAGYYGCFATRWRHQKETFSALLDLCVGNPQVTGGFPSQRPETESFDVSSDMRLNKRLSKQSRRLRRHRAHYDAIVMYIMRALGMNLCVVSVSLVGIQIFTIWASLCYKSNNRLASMMQGGTMILTWTILHKCHHEHIINEK